uniref:Uncharacterized protein n=2 Tax=viral metagenome TaxID=1070528 RepID=A0A6M3XCU5_9ZZZZ
MPIYASPLRSDVAYMIDDQPIVFHRYILITGDGVDTGNSWQWNASYKGRIDPLGQNVWFSQKNVLGETAKRVYTVLLPYTAVGLDTGDKMELYTIGGVSRGTFTVLYVDEYYDSSGSAWKVEANVERWQG